MEEEEDYSMVKRKQRPAPVRSSPKKPEWNNDFTEDNYLDQHGSGREVDRHEERGETPKKSAVTPSRSSKPPKLPHGGGLAHPEATPSQKAQDAALKKVDQTVPPEYICPLGRHVMKDPVVAEDGYAYERENIESWLSKHSTSPITGKELQYRVVFECKNMKRLVTKFNSERLEKMQGKGKPKWMTDWSSDEEGTSSLSQSARFDDVNDAGNAEKEDKSKRHWSAPVSKGPRERAAEAEREIEERMREREEREREREVERRRGETQRQAPPSRVGSAASSRLAALKAKMASRGGGRGGDQTASGSGYDSSEREYREEPERERRRQPPPQRKQPSPQPRLEEGIEFFFPCWVGRSVRFRRGQREERERSSVDDARSS
uniref:U-box domain-containing protein n=1 Tax=Palpitomonas bilix TaxID=652834 RepID=A0A7S3D965_9EUKA|mmetsp:Transcript_26868/g.69068  ORF Transcript_26868/g.69068 Transcript_26868/m.69068 type:complete len:376 (+) Transcript_26868:99-1226(+)